MRSNAGATGDNRNAIALSDALRAGVLDGGTISVAGAVERLTADVGLQTRTAQVNRDAEAVVNSDNLAARDSRVRRESGRGSRRDAALPAGLPGRGADHRDGEPACSIRC